MQLYKLCLICCALLVHHRTYAQLLIKTVDDLPFSEQTLVEQVLLGEGVEILHVKYDGQNESLGYFDRGLGEIGICQGLVMSTGQVDELDRGNDEDNFGGTSSGELYSDNDLSSLTLGTLKDIARYEITFIPSSDNLSFEYIFASEEYPEFVCSRFNDVFGFFITGPSPQGGNYNALNIAMVSNESGDEYPVAINTINGGMVGNSSSTDCSGSTESLDFGQLYNDNVGSQNFTLDGFTDVLKAEVSVIPCAEYTIKLVIADGTDVNFDSAVFLKASSFSSQSLQASLVTTSSSSILTEGCSSGEIIFEIPDVLQNDLRLDFRILDQVSGLEMATVNQDYSAINTSLEILAGNKQVSLPIEIIDDLITENTEYIALEYVVNECKLDTILIPIQDYTLRDFQNLEDREVCLGDRVDIVLDLDLSQSRDSTFISEASAVLGDMKVLGNPQLQHPAYSIPIEILPSDIIPSEDEILRVCIDSMIFVANDFEAYSFYLINPKGRVLSLIIESTVDFDDGTAPPIGPDVDTLTHLCFTPLNNQNILDQNQLLQAISDVNHVDDLFFEINGNWNTWIDFSDNDKIGTWQMVITIDGALSAFGLMNNINRLESWSLSFGNDYKINTDISGSVSGSFCTDCGTLSFYPDQSEIINIQIEDNYGCQESLDINVLMNDVPDQPQDLSCQLLSPETLSFNWSEIIDATTEYSVDNAPWQEIITNGYIMSEVPSGTTVELCLRAVNGICPSDTSCLSCTTPGCVPPIISEMFIFNPTCYGSDDGTIELMLVGGATPYLFTLGEDSNADGVFENLGSGTYTIDIVDANNCPNSIELVVDEAELMELESEVKNTSCIDSKDGSIVVHVTGGLAPYKLSWVDDKGDNYIGDKLENLNIGTYNLMVEDANGCKFEEQFIVDFEYFIDVQISTTTASCFGAENGSVQVFVQSNSEVNNIAYYHAQNEQIPIVDAQSLAAGDYFVEIFTLEGCQMRELFTITQPDILSYALTADNEICFYEELGQLAIKGVGGTQPYEYRWASGVLDSAIVDIPPASYSFNITDSKGCMIEDSIKLSRRDSLVIDLSIEEVLCHNDIDGSAKINGVMSGDDFIPVEDLNIKWNLSGEFDPSIQGLFAGASYSITVTDENGCTNSSMFTLQNPDPIGSALVDVSDVSCNSGRDGMIEVVGEGGVEPYSYLWNAQANFQDSSVATNLLAGSYLVTVTDHNGCTSTLSQIIDQPTPYNYNLSSSSVKCKGDNTGRVGVFIGGATPPYDIRWSTGDTTEAVDGLSMGVYSLSITDANNCQVVDSLFLDEPQEDISLMVESYNADCENGGGGGLIIEASGGTRPYIYSTDSLVYFGNNEIVGLATGNYDVYVKDANGCLATDGTFAVDQNEEIKLYIGPREVLVRYGDSYVPPVMISDAFGEINYDWSIIGDAQLSCDDCEIFRANDIQSNLTIQLDIIDENGCIASDRVSVVVTKKVDIEVPTAFSPNNDLNNDYLSVFGRPEIKIDEFSIFDITGAMIYRSEEIEINKEVNGWDGSFRNNPAPQGTYIWSLRYTLPDGSSDIIKGESTLIR